MEKKQLVAAAKEINDVFGLDPKIKTVAIKEDDLKLLVLKAGRLREPDDDLSDETIEVLEELESDKALLKREKAESKADADEEEKPEPEPDSPEPDEEDDEAELDDDEVELEDAVQKADLKELKKLVKEYDEFKSLRKKVAGKFDIRELRDSMLGLLGIEPEPDENEEPEEKPTPKPEKEKPAVSKKQAPPRKKRFSYPVGKTLRPAKSGTKVSKAIDFIVENDFTDLSFIELGEANEWSPTLAKAYVTDNINKLGYGVELDEKDPDCFSIILPEKVETAPKHI